MKEKTINGLQKAPPEYPICVTIHMNNAVANAIDKQYDEWEKKLKTSNPEFKVEFNVVKVDIMVLLKSLISPPNTAFFLGLTLAMNRVREIIFDGNIYFDNIVDGLKLISGNLISLSCHRCGLSSQAKKRNSRNSPFLAIKTSHRSNFHNKISYHSRTGNRCCLAMEKNIRERMCDISCVSLGAFFPLVSSVIDYIRGAG